MENCVIYSTGCKVKHCTKLVDIENSVKHGCVEQGTTGR